MKRTAKFACLAVALCAFALATVGRPASLSLGSAAVTASDDAKGGSGTG